MDSENKPKVSILLPNLNNRRFLKARFQSIFEQTLEDWELIVVDSYSDDGAWELIQEYAKDERLVISQAPREGIYPGLNRCIEQARGEYIYIATSDDTMDPDCLGKMVTAMAAHPECDICHTCLRVIDEAGETLKSMWRGFPVAEYFGELMDVPHIRVAPYDGILHSAVYTVYTSLTQILIRRTVFEQVGLFRDDWGSECDFEWSMRATLLKNTLHLPEELATWRVYPDQATANVDLDSSRRHQRLCEMIEAAITSARTIDPTFSPRVRIRKLQFPYRCMQVALGVWEQPGKLRKLGYLGRMLFVNPLAVMDFIRDTVFSEQNAGSDQVYIRKELKRLNLEDNVKVLTQP